MDEVQVQACFQAGVQTLREGEGYGQPQLSLACNMVKFLCAV